MSTDKAVVVLGLLHSKQKHERDFTTNAGGSKFMIAILTYVVKYIIVNFCYRRKLGPT